MKRIFFTLTLSVFAISIFFYSCGDSSQNGDSSQKTVADQKLGKLKIEIPESLKNKPEVVAYIHDMNKVADGYAILIDDMFVELGDYINKDENDLGMMDKIKIMKATADISIKSFEMLAK